MSSDFSICLVGAGNMGGAMLAGWLDSGIDASNITVIDPSVNESVLKILARKNITPHDTVPADYTPDVMIVAIKPQIMEAVLPSLKGMIGSNTVSVSIAAGTTLAVLEKHLGSSAIVRAMPNTPALLRKGITVGCANDVASKVQIDRVDQLLHAIGKVSWVDDEGQIDAVTAVSGSGPAYVFLLAETMATAGIKEGLSPELANQLARETIAGAGAMLSVLSDSSARLRENVTSPNGTTAAAMDVLMADPGMAELMAAAINAARKRSQALS